jgi:hypothetical protein
MGCLELLEIVPEMVSIDFQVLGRTPRSNQALVG